MAVTAIAWHIKHEHRKHGRGTAKLTSISILLVYMTITVPQGNEDQIYYTATGREASASLVRPTSTTLPRPTERIEQLVYASASPTSYLSYTEIQTNLADSRDQVAITIYYKSTRSPRTLYEIEMKRKKIYYIKMVGNTMLTLHTLSRAYKLGPGLN